jgi:SAM-dependent methyltransferase
MPSQEKEYLKYVQNDRHMKEYNDYQNKYSSQPSERDKITISAVVRHCRKIAEPLIFDAGCSTANLLFHLRRALPNAKLHGADLSPSSIQKAKGNPALTGVDLQIADITSLPASYRFRFDVTIANAVLGSLEDPSYLKSVKALSQTLVPGGLLIVFDWITSFEQELEVREFSKDFPNGLFWKVRSQKGMLQTLGQLGLTDITFEPFYMPIPLARSEDKSSIVSYTIAGKDGPLLSFRGCFHQPWSHCYSRRIR